MSLKKCMRMSTLPIISQPGLHPRTFYTQSCLIYSGFGDAQAKRLSCLTRGIIVMGYIYVLGSGKYIFCTK